MPRIPPDPEGSNGSSKFERRSQADAGYLPILAWGINSNMSYQVLARKWRPRSFTQMVGQEHIVRLLTHALDEKRLHHAYLFTGTRGVGKTTLARILAKCLNCEIGVTSVPCEVCKNCTAIDTGRFLDLLEVDAASRTKVEDTRELLDNIHYQPNQGRYKVYLIDEIHMLSGHSFNALLKTLEEPPPYVIFLLATTDPKRLPVTVLSRCLQLNLKRISVEHIKQQLQHICTIEAILNDTAALQLLALAADGSLRDALSLLDQAIAFCHGKITLTDTQQMLGSIAQDALVRLLQALAEQDGVQLLAEIAKLAEFAVDFNQALADLLSLLHQINVTQIIDPSMQQNEQIVQLAKRFTAENVQLYYQIALIGRRDLPFAPDPQLGFEMVMLRMLAFKPVTESNTEPAAQQNSLAEPALAKEQVQPSSAPISSPSAWAEILTHLDLSGMAQALATNCILLTITETHVTLALSKQHEPMFNKKLADRIEQALSHYLNKPIKLDIQMTAVVVDTPAKQQHQMQIIRQTAATEAIKNDSQVQKMMRLFDATLNVDSIHYQE
jgi:DNA polymerase-3 subunit gamma/tau